jgi:outer membrane immunogenic protein
MRFDKTTLLAATLAIFTTLPLHAQQVFGTAPGQTPVLEASLGYTFLHANAPPGQCGCFSANGGFGSLVVSMPHNFGVVADLNVVHNGNVGGTQSFTLFNYLFGPRYSLRKISRRFTPYVQVLGGGSQQFSSYAAAQGLQGPAFSVGGGGLHRRQASPRLDHRRSRLDPLLYSQRAKQSAERHPRQYRNHLPPRTALTTCVPAKSPPRQTVTSQPFS